MMRSVYETRLWLVTWRAFDQPQWKAFVGEETARSYAAALGDFFDMIDVVVEPLFVKRQMEVRLDQCGPDPAGADQRG